MTTQGSIAALPDTHPANEVMIALVGGTPGAGPQALGSAVFIAPGIALTAHHVIEAYWDQFDDLGRLTGNAKAGFALQALQYVPDFTTPVLWHVIAAWHADAIDIAVLQLVPDRDLARDYRWPYVTLDLAPPPVGTEVQALGFPESQVTHGGAVHGWVLEHEPAGARGLVTQVFPTYRDRAKLHFPCFEMAVEVLGGMSGGAVFNRTGHLCGIVCSSFEFADEGPHVAFASLLWPSMALPIHPTPHLGLSAGDTRLLHLARDGRLNALNHERLRLPSDTGDVTQAALE